MPSRPATAAAMAGAVALLSCLAAPAAGAQDSAAVAAPAAAPDVVYDSTQVDRRARERRGACYPEYPRALRATMPTGEVLATFVVDTTGQVERETLVVLSATHEPFAVEVRKAVRCYRYAPAMLQGRKVRQRVLQPFVFDVQR